MHVVIKHLLKMNQAALARAVLPMLKGGQGDLVWLDQHVVQQSQAWPNRAMLADDAGKLLTQKLLQQFIAGHAMRIGDRCQNASQGTNTQGVVQRDCDVMLRGRLAS